MIGQRMPDTQWKKPEQACGWAKYRLYYEPPIWTYRKRSAPRTPRKVGRLRAGQVDRLCSSRWLDRVATDDFVPLDWLSARTLVAVIAAAIIRRAR